MYQKQKLSRAIIAITAAMSASHYATAQDTSASEADEIIVSGIRGSLMRSQDIKRDGNGVVDAISAEDIGKFPDQNLAESLQRITGVSIDRSGGEGKLITVRGFGPDFNTVLVNGRQMASENDTRAFSFDTISADMVNSINVYKTATATQQSGGIGATVNITTARPLAFDGLKIAGSIKALNDNNSGETTPEFSALIADTFNDGTFGALLAVSHKNAKTRLNQAQTDGWLENAGIPKAELNGGAGFAGNVFSPRNYDTKVTFEERTRTNTNLVLQYKPQDNLTLTADALFSDFDIETDATSYGHWFTAPNVENAKTDAHGTVIDLYQETGLATDFHAKKFDRLTSTKSYGLQADWDVTDKLNIVFDISKSNAERAANNGGGDQLSLIGYKNRVRFQSDSAILPWTSQFQTPATGLIYDTTTNATHSVSDYLDPANGRAHVMLRRGWAVEDDISQYKMDGVWKEGADAGLDAVKFGVMMSDETKSLTRWDNEGGGVHCIYCGYPDSPDIPNDFLTVFNAGSDFLSKVSGHGRTPTSWLRHDGEQQFAFLESKSGVSFDAKRKDNSYSVEEKTNSAYFEFDFVSTIANMPLKTTTGARLESTDVTVVGTQAPIEKLTILDQTEMVSSYGSATPIAADASYKALLPNMSASLNISDDVVARIAASRSLTRAPLNNMAPVTNIGTTRPGTLTASAGNPALKPFLSDNMDLSLEWYYGDASYVSAGFFWKDVNNFIVTGTKQQTFVTSNGSLLTDPSTGANANAPDASDATAVFTVTLPSNGEEAIVDGVELALQHTFGESGFGVIVNGTLVNSDAELKAGDVTQKFAVTGISNSANVVGFYEQGPYQLRIAYNWRDKFLQSLTQSNGDGVVHVAAYGQWDMSGSYEVNENVSVLFEATNLTEEVVTKYGRYNNQFLLAEDAGRRISVGIQAKF
jgi:iron complex outermembrane recepter protein